MQPMSMLRFQRGDAIFTNPLKLFFSFNSFKKSAPICLVPLTSLRQQGLTLRRLFTLGFQLQTWQL